MADSSYWNRKVPQCTEFIARDENRKGALFHFDFWRNAAGIVNGKVSGEKASWGGEGDAAIFIAQGSRSAKNFDHVRVPFEFIKSPQLLWHRSLDACPHDGP